MSHWQIIKQHMYMAGHLFDCHTHPEPIIGFCLAINRQLSHLMDKSGDYLKKKC